MEVEIRRTVNYSLRASLTLFLRMHSFWKKIFNIGLYFIF